MDDLIAEAKALCEASTPGSWDIWTPDNITAGYSNIGRRAKCHAELEIATVYNTNSSTNGQRENAEFIARARTLVPELVELVEQAEARAEEADGKVKALERAYKDDCDTCKNNIDECYYECHVKGRSLWQFDYERFKEGEHERDD